MRCLKSPLGRASIGGAMLAMALSASSCDDAIEEALNTEVHSELGGAWPASSMSVEDVAWRFVSLDAGGVRGSFSFTWRNGRSVPQLVAYQLRFTDSAGFELDRYPPNDDLMVTVPGSGAAPASGSFILDDISTITVANTIAALEIWAGFDPQWDDVRVTPPQLSTGVSGEAYVDTLAATGGDGTYIWLVRSGSLPAGLSLSTAGILSGTPVARAREIVTFEATSAGLVDSDVVSVIVIDRPQITSSILSNGRVSFPYFQTLQMTGGDLFGLDEAWSLVSGNVPPGLALAGNGTVSGTPIQVGTWTFRVRLAVYEVSTEGDITITIE